MEEAGSESTTLLILRHNEINAILEESARVKIRFNEPFIIFHRCRDAGIHVHNKFSEFNMHFVVLQA